MRKVYLKLTVSVTILANDDLDIGQYLENSQLTLTCHDARLADKADVHDLTIEEKSVVDSK